jgi:hypothetical protein
MNLVTYAVKVHAATPLSIEESTMVLLLFILAPADVESAIGDNMKMPHSKGMLSVFKFWNTNIYKGGGWTTTLLNSL